MFTVLAIVKGWGDVLLCVIEIIDSKHPLPDFERNEEATIRKTGIMGTNIPIGLSANGRSFIT